MPLLSAKSLGERVPIVRLEVARDRKKISGKGEVLKFLSSQK